MAGSKTDTFEARFLDFIFKNNTHATPLVTPNNSIYVALYTTAPSESSAGTEVSGSSYARVQVPTANWTRTVSSVANNTEVVFPAVTTSAYTVVGWAIMDASTTGNMLYWGDTTSTTMNVGDIPRFPPTTGIVITED